MSGIQLNFESKWSYQETWLDLCNTSQEFLAYKLKTNRPQLFMVSPNRGLLTPGETIKVTFTLRRRLLPKDLPSGGDTLVKFLISWFILPPGRDPWKFDLVNFAPDKMQRFSCLIRQEIGSNGDGNANDMNDSKRLLMLLPHLTPPTPVDSNNNGKKSDCTKWKLFSVAFGFFFCLFHGSLFVQQLQDYVNGHFSGVQMPMTKDWQWFDDGFGGITFMMVPSKLSEQKRGYLLNGILTHGLWTFASVVFLLTVTTFRSNVNCWACCPCLILPFWLATALQLVSVVGLTLRAFEATIMFQFELAVLNLHPAIFSLGSSITIILMLLCLCSVIFHLDHLNVSYPLSPLRPITGKDVPKKTQGNDGSTPLRGNPNYSNIRLTIIDDEEDKTTKGNESNLVYLVRSSFCYMSALTTLSVHGWLLSKAIMNHTEEEHFDLDHEEDRAAGNQILMLSYGFSNHFFWSSNGTVGQVLEYKHKFYLVWHCTWILASFLMLVSLMNKKKALVFLWVLACVVEYIRAQTTIYELWSWYPYVDNLQPLVILFATSVTVVVTSTFTLSILKCHMRNF